MRELHWRQWNILHWNNAFLAHYFTQPADRAWSPVTQLLVTPTEFATATGDATADAKLATDAFVSSLRRELHPSGRAAMRFCASAADYAGWRSEEGEDHPPQFVAHLILTCYAAALTDETGEVNENSVLERLDYLCGTERVAGHPPDCVPQLWEDLRRWLEVASEQTRGSDRRYRTLVLPDPGGLTRIGYSVRLAFPNSRDIQRVREVFAEEDLLGDELPAGAVMDVLTRRAASFSPRFRVAVQELRSTWLTGGDVRRHPLWCALPMASRASEARLRHRFSLLLQEGKLDDVWVVTTEEGAASVKSVSLSPTVENWTHIVDDDDIFAPTRRAIGGDATFQEIATLARQGVLLFRKTEYGEFILAHRFAPEASIAVVREELVSDFLGLASRDGISPVVRECRFPGWRVVKRIRLQPIGPASGSRLASVWCLQETVSARRLRLRDGIRVGDCWLGFSECLPVVAMEGVDRIEATKPNGTSAMERLDESLWTFPEGDLASAVQLSAFNGGVEVQRCREEFVTTVDTTEFRTLSPKPGLKVEGARADLVGLDGTDATVACASEDLPDVVSNLTDTIYLGPRIGDVSRTPRPHFVWAVHRGLNGRTWQFEFVGDPATPVEPVPERLSATRRFWAKRFNEAALKRHPDSRVAELFSRYRSLLNRDDIIDLETTAPVQLTSPIPSPKAVRVESGVERLERAIAAMASRRSGIDEGTVLDLVRAFLGWRVPVWSLLRAWQESFAVDVVYNLQYRGRTYVPLRPQLVSYSVGSVVRARLCGLGTSEVRNRVAAQAKRLGIEVKELPSISSWLSPTIEVRATTRDRLDVLASETHVLHRQVARLERIAAPIATVVSDRSEMPSQYRERFCWDPTVRRFVPASGAAVAAGIELWRKQNAPDCYVVWSGGVPRYWTYSRNWAFWALAVRSGEPLLRVNEAAGSHESDGELFLPLPVARYWSLLAPSLSGPIGDGRFVYQAPSWRMLDALQDLLGVRFRPPHPSGEPK